MPIKKSRQHCKRKTNGECDYGNDQIKTLFELAKKSIRSSLWETPPVSDQSSITLTRWSVKETHTGERHFVGYNLEDCEGRVSTAIRSFDQTTGFGITESGRVYRLVGPPGYDPDGDWVWTHWASSRKVDWQDVTDEFTTGFTGL